MDWTQPIETTQYLQLLNDLKNRDIDSISLCLDNPTNPITGMMKYDRTRNVFQEWTGSAWTDRVLAIAGGGTGTSVGEPLGTMASQNANAVNITGGTVGGNTTINTTGNVTTPLLTAVSGAPSVTFKETSAPVDQKIWDFYAYTSTFGLRLFNDATSLATYAFTISRSGYNVTGINFPAPIGVGTSPSTSGTSIQAAASISSLVAPGSAFTAGLRRDAGGAWVYHATNQAGWILNSEAEGIVIYQAPATGTAGVAAPIAITHRLKADGGMVVNGAIDTTGIIYANAVKTTSWLQADCDVTSTGLYLNAQPGTAYAGIQFRDSTGTTNLAKIRTNSNGSFEFTDNAGVSFIHMNLTALHPMPGTGYRFLGYPTYFWTATYSQKYIAQNGTTGAPAYTFETSTSTGMHYIGSAGYSGITFVCDGADILTLDKPNNLVWIGTHLAPRHDGASGQQHYCGTSSYRWYIVYSFSGVSTGSDIRLKDVKGPTRLGLNFINKLNPIEYTWVTRKSKLRHGIIAQELKATLDELKVEFDGLYEPEREAGQWGLNYSEFIAPIIKAIQELDDKVDVLRSEINAKKATGRQQ